MEIAGDKIIGNEKRRQLVGWLRVFYPSKRTSEVAVDLGSIEVFDNETGRTTAIVMANPIAPGAKY